MRNLPCSRSCHWSTLSRLRGHLSGEFYCRVTVLPDFQYILWRSVKFLLSAVFGWDSDTSVVLAFRTLHWLSEVFFVPEESPLSFDRWPQFCVYRLYRPTEDTFGLVRENPGLERGGHYPLHRPNPGCLCLENPLLMANCTRNHDFHCIFQRKIHLLSV